jgi:hypothetical protein
VSLRINHRRKTRPDAIGWERLHAPDQASNADLLWYYFPGDVEIIADGVALASTVGSAPALHFISAMIGAREALTADSRSHYQYNFTEANQCINLQRAGGYVRIECDFSANVLTIPLDEFLREACSFARREIEALGHEFPALLTHPLAHELLGKCGGDQEADFT